MRTTSGAARSPAETRPVPTIAWSSRNIPELRDAGDGALPRRGGLAIRTRSAASISAPPPATWSATTPPRAGSHERRPRGGDEPDWGPSPQSVLSYDSARTGSRREHRHVFPPEQPVALAENGGIARSPDATQRNRARHSRRPSRQCGQLRGALLAAQHRVGRAAGPARRTRAVAIGRTRQASRPPRRSPRRTRPTCSRRPRRRGRRRTAARPRPRSRRRDGRRRSGSRAGRRRPRPRPAPRRAAASCARSCGRSPRRARRSARSRPRRPRRPRRGASSGRRRRAGSGRRTRGTARPSRRRRRSPSRSRRAARRARRAFAVPPTLTAAAPCGSSSAPSTFVHAAACSTRSGRAGRPARGKRTSHSSRVSAVASGNCSASAWPSCPPAPVIRTPRPCPVPREAAISCSRGRRRADRSRASRARPGRPRRTPR